MAITMLRKKPAGEIKELDEKAVDDFLDSASHVKKEVQNPFCIPLMRLRMNWDSPVPLILTRQFPLP